MSWDILPKSNLQYFLTKLKGIFDNKVDKEAGKGLFSGNYNDLTNKPSIPAAANNNTITIQLNGTTVETFTLNQASDETINIQVTKSSVGLGNVGNFKAVSTEASQGLTDTEKTNARANIGAGTSSTDQQVYQENTNTNTDYRVLLGVENDTTSYVYKSIGLRYNPGKDSVYTEKINDTVLGDAIGFDVQDSSSASDLTNGLLPTGQTIKSYLNSNLMPISFQSISAVSERISDFGHNSFISAGVLHFRGYFRHASDIADQTALFSLSGKTAKFRSEGILVDKNPSKFDAPIYINANDNKIILNSYMEATNQWCFVIIDIALN